MNDLPRIRTEKYLGRSLAIVALVSAGSVVLIWPSNDRNERYQPQILEMPKAPSIEPQDMGRELILQQEPSHQSFAHDEPHFSRFFSHDPSGLQELKAAYEEWHRLNPAIAKKLAQLAGERTEGARRAVWTQAELALAIKWVTELAEGETKFALMAELGKRLFAFDREGAAELSNLYTNEIYYHGHLTEMVEEWAVTDSYASSAWVAVFPPGLLRNNLELKVAIRAAEDEPASAANYIALLDPGPHRDAAAQTVARQWAARDPQAAVRWAASYPDKGLRQELLSVAVAYWKRQDYRSLRKWIQEDPSDPIRTIAAELEESLH